MFELRSLQPPDAETAARRLYESAGHLETGRRQTDRFLFIDYNKVLGSKR